MSFATVLLCWDFASVCTFLWDQVNKLCVRYKCSKHLTIVPLNKKAICNRSVSSSLVFAVMRLTFVEQSHRLDLAAFCPSISHLFLSYSLTLVLFHLSQTVSSHIDRCRKETKTTTQRKRQNDSVCVCICIFFRVEKKRFFFCCCSFHLVIVCIFCLCFCRRMISFGWVPQWIAANVFGVLVSWIHIDITITRKEEAKKKKNTNDLSRILIVFQHSIRYEKRNDTQKNMHAIVV